MVEEPEAYLFPVAQKQIIDFAITTHSPYILSSLNNLLYAYNLGADKSEYSRFQVDEVQSSKQDPRLLQEVGDLSVTYLKKDVDALEFGVQTRFPVLNYCDRKADPHVFQRRFDS